MIETQEHAKKCFISHIDIRIAGEKDSDTTIIKMNIGNGEIEFLGIIPPRVIRWISELTLEIRELNRGNGHKIKETN